MGKGYRPQLPAADGDVYSPTRRGEAHWEGVALLLMGQLPHWRPGGPPAAIGTVGQRTAHGMGTSAIQRTLNEFNGRRKRLARGVSY